VVPESRLLKYRRIDNVTGCWNWTGSTQNGYGQLNDKGRVFRVNRLAAHFWLGFDIESDKLILHKCDNKKCFNPEHLYIGDKGDNSKDYHASLKAQGRVIKDWFVSNSERV